MDLPRVAVVIPAYRELEYIHRPLDSMSASVRAASAAARDRLDVVVVVNHPHDASAEIREESETLLLHLRERSSTLPFRLHILDRTEPGLRNGVGEARKIGMDFAVQSILPNPEDRIVSLDADTAVAENYFETLFTHSLSGAGFTLAFRHRSEEAENPEAIEIYDRYLRQMVDGMKRAGSPFAFFTIGSAIGTTRKYYELSGGMPARKATEDFHFLNKLRKYGLIEEWEETCVYPAPRRSERVFLGTGYFLSSYRRDPKAALDSLRLPSSEAFDILKETLETLNNSYRDLDLAHKRLQQDPGVDSFLSQYRIWDRLKKLRNNSTTEESYKKKLLQVFDGLMAWRLLKKIGDSRVAPIS